MDLVFRRVLLEVCHMFKEMTLIIKVNDSSTIPIPQVVREKVGIVYLFSKSGSLLKSKFLVASPDQTKKRAMVNSVLLRETDFELSMFCLYAGQEIKETMSYDSQL